MTTAIYARKSTEQYGNEETRSVANQVQFGRAFSKKLGFGEIADEHLYIDDAVSGADVRNLFSRARLMANVEAGRIQRVIMADFSRFSRRDGDEVVRELKQIARKAEVWFYETGQRFQHGDIGTNIANYAMAESNADLRRKSATKTMNGMITRAKKGHSMTGPCFGYKCIDVPSGQLNANGQPVRDHVDREIIPEQAAIVVEIYERYAGGEGFKLIANALNERRVPTPRPRRAKGEDGVARPYRPAAWATSSVRAILKNPSYRGLYRWNYLKQRNASGDPILEVNPESEQVKVDKPHWQIVSDALLEAVDARFAAHERKPFGLKGRGGQQPKYLLSGGMLICPTCKGRFCAVNNKYYVCSVRRHSGDSVCNNQLKIHIDKMDDAVLHLVEDEVLHPDVIAALLDRVALEQTADGRGALVAERDEAAKIIRNLTVMMARLGEDTPPEMVEEIRTQTAIRNRADRRLASLAVPIERGQLKKLLEERATDWRKKIRSNHLDAARFILRQLVGPIELWEGAAENLPLDWETTPNPRDTRGKENISWSDCGFRGQVTPEGLLNGLCAHMGIAGGGLAYVRTAARRLSAVSVAEKRERQTA